MHHIFKHCEEGASVIFVITMKENCYRHTAHTFSHISDFDYCNMKMKFSVVQWTIAGY
jgi:hypothetical protein